jgi:phage anti-repressor protein
MKRNKREIKINEKDERGMKKNKRRIKNNKET